MSLTAPEYIRSLSPYVPGKPIEETRREFKLKRVIKLASNENPLGPSPKAVLAVRKATRELHRYPDGAAFALKAALSSHLGVEPRQLIVGNGSNEIIDLIIRTYCLPGDQIVAPQAAFIAYRLCAQIHGVTTVETPNDARLCADLGAILEAARKNDRVRVVFLANPNNPTGTHVGAQALRSFLREVAKIRGGGVLVALDAAYEEYVTASDIPGSVELQREFSQNLIAMRTFSKIYGLAGLRTGYGVASPEIISTLEKVRQPFNVNSLGLVGAEAALSDKAFVKRARTVNAQGMKFWEKGLDKLGVPYWKSQGNFILCDVWKGFGKTGIEIYQQCLRQGVIFRPVANYGLAHALRISIGTPMENKLGLAALSRCKGSG
jgi:histidinol-phosphate aminotransferase